MILRKDSILVFQELPKPLKLTNPQTKALKQLNNLTIVTVFRACGEARLVGGRRHSPFNAVISKSAAENFGSLSSTFKLNEPVSTRTAEARESSGCVIGPCNARFDGHSHLS